MRRLFLCGSALVLLASTVPTRTVGAQAAPSDWRSEFVLTMQGAADKYIQLAEAIPQDKYTWRPGEGVRSVAEVLLHISAASYNLGSRLGPKPPAGLDLRNFERSTTDKATIIRHVRESFAFFRQAVEAFPASESERMIPWFGPPQVTARHFLYFNADHNGEHLGQLIAYARMNGIRPPWSGAGN